MADGIMADDMMAGGMTADGMTADGLGKYIDFNAGISNKGDTRAVRKVMERAAAGERIKLGFIGGSITQGFAATSPKKCYAYLVYRWWCENFPKAEFEYINAGIGATTSQFGVARADDDLLVHEPDFVIVEFSVNDSPTEHDKETYEGLVRKILSAKSAPALMAVHNVFYDSGGSTQLTHAKVVRYYNLPAVSMQSSIYPALAAGLFDNGLITDDNLHPNDLGHELVGRVVTNYLDKIKNRTDTDGIDICALAEVQCGECGTVGSGFAQDDGTCFSAKCADSVSPARVTRHLPDPLTRNAYEDSVRIQNYNSSPMLNGFVADRTPQAGITDIFKRGWTARNNDDSIHFEVEGSCIAVQYRRAVRPSVGAASKMHSAETSAVMTAAMAASAAATPDAMTDEVTPFEATTSASELVAALQLAPTAVAVVDGDIDNAVVLDGNFDETWGDKLELTTILEHGENKVHTVDITIAETYHASKKDFYLVSIIVSGSAV